MPETQHGGPVPSASPTGGTPDADGSAGPAGVPTVRVTRFFDVPAPLAFALLADGRNHGALIPLTRVTGDDPAVGEVIRAVSGPFARRSGRGLVDTMRIDRWDPPAGAAPGDAPGRSRFTKLGPLLLGTAGIDVSPALPVGGRERCRVTWTETVHLAGPVPARLTGPLLAPVLRAMLLWSLRAADPYLRGHAGA
ncbi:hypothetical protein [Cellulomonas endophytica]|uniref:hypothetical protein n=1 Tax=Cellulomonas endophytica TaxID=2494735 RepID=UPI001012B0A7|nr:hypothetical protein [Cellulomonas endophytica]